MRLYISGPMRGIRGCNFDLFDEAEQKLILLGHDPISPASHDRGLGFDFSDCETCSNSEIEAKGFRMAGALRWDIGVIIDAETDGVLLLDGWSRSSGSVIEVVANLAVGGRFFRLEGDQLVEMFVDAHLPSVVVRYGDKD